MRRTQATVLVTVRTVLLLAGCSAATAATCWLAVPPLRILLTAPTPAALPLDALVLGLCGALLLGCVGWLLALTTITLAAHTAHLVAPGSRRVAALAGALDRLSPRVVRRLVAATLGATLTAGVAAPALAADGAPVGPTGGLSGLRLPDRSVGTTLSVASPRTVALDPPRGLRGAGHQPAAPHTLVVAPGDSLWSLAAELLPPHAGAPRIAAAWESLQRANVDRIGPDPDLILPGTRLVVPDPAPAHREDAP